MALLDLNRGQNSTETFRSFVTVRDYGGGLVEMGYSPYRPVRDDRPKYEPQGELLKKRAAQDAANKARALRRAKAQVRRKCLSGGLDHLLTLTYRNNVTDLRSAWSDFSKFVRRVRDRQGGFKYLAVHEFQSRGAVHFHVAVRGFQNVRLLRSLWLSCVGEGNIDVRGPRSRGSAIWQRARLAGYLSKYIGKDLVHDQGRQRYRVAEGIEIPQERHVVEFRQGQSLVDLVMDSLGVSVGFHWKSNDGPYGWACSW